MLAFAPLVGAVGAAAHVVALLAGALQPVVGAGATAAAIMLFTVVVRLAISPLSWLQIRGERRRAALAPRIRELQRRYRDQPVRLRTELVAAHREAGVSPWASLLPGVAQAPFFLLMYRLFTVPTDADAGANADGDANGGRDANADAGGDAGAVADGGGDAGAGAVADAGGDAGAVADGGGDAGAGAVADGGAGAVAGGVADAGGLLAERLFGVPLGHHLGDGLAGSAGLVFGVLLGLLVLLAWWSSRRMRRAAAGGAATDRAAAGGSVGGTAAGGAEVPGAAVVARLLPLLPYGTVLVALFVPLAAVLYLVTTTAWTGLEQVVLRRGRASTDVDTEKSGT
ncbi:membrane protein insertase YidC [Plantactinospora sp. WMMB334]|uniref:membrane protein insertase YidC n=1 Tax=Plantactinospora sp. WMMB334 TaxID=3404119 RepID=UPI003B927C7F